MKPKLLLAFAASALLAPVALGNDWPSWRGPHYNGISDETGLSTTWGKAPKVLWRAQAGVGYSAVAVADGRAYTLGWEGGKDYVRCLDAATGKELWNHSYPCAKFDKYHQPGGPGATPTIHEGRVYTLSMQGDLFCLDAKSGSVVWGKQAAKELGSELPTWGFSGSPIVEGDKLIVDIGTVGAFDLKTGDLKWKSKPLPAAYSTPVAFDKDGKRLVASFNASGLAVLDAAGGEVIATYPWKTQYDVNAATPIIAEGGGLIFISSGYGRGATLVSFKDGKLEKVWETKEMRNQMNPSVLIGKTLYGFDGNAGSGQLTCMEIQTGKVLWQQRGLGTGALTAADGKLIIMSEKGDLAIAEANPAAYKELARGKVLGGINWTVPVLANGRVYCRNDQGEVACVDVGGK